MPIHRVFGVEVAEKRGHAQHALAIDLLAVGVLRALEAVFLLALAAAAVAVLGVAVVALFVNH